MIRNLITRHQHRAPQFSLHLIQMTRRLRHRLRMITVMAIVIVGQNTSLISRFTGTPDVLDASEHTYALCKRAASWSGQFHRICHGNRRTILIRSRRIKGLLFYPDAYASRLSFEGGQAITTFVKSPFLRGCRLTHSRAAGILHYRRILAIPTILVILYSIQFNKII